MLIQGLQALPPDERLLEDRLLIQLAKVGLECRARIGSVELKQLYSFPTGKKMAPMRLWRKWSELTR